MKTIRIISRLLVLPFVAAIALIACLRLWLIHCVNFLRYGGEFIAYTDKYTVHTILDCYKKLNNID